MRELDTFVGEVQQDLPDIHLTDDIRVLHNYAVDGQTPRLVLTPTTTEDVGKLIELAARYELTVLARGNGSRMQLGALPEPFDVLIETRKLTRLLEHEALTLTCRTEAGITLAQLQEQLALKGQWLPLDVPDATLASLGGLLATNASGPKRLRYGTIRDLVLGLQVVQASGVPVRSDKRTVQDASGYDLHKAFVGSLGTLGVIVEATFKLQPLPANERTLLLTFVNSQDCMQTVIDLQSSTLTPSAIELIDAAAIGKMSHAWHLTIPANGYTLAIDFEGELPTIIHQMDEARTIARDQGALLGDDLQDEDQAVFWHTVRQHLHGPVTCKAAILVSRMTDYLHHLDEICQHYQLEASVIAHAGNGILHIQLSPADATTRLVTAIAELRQHAQEARGTLVVERCASALKPLVDVWGKPGATFRLMQQLKKEFDPKGTFVKGRFVGGL